MYNCPPKFKARKPITDEKKIKQIKSWNESDINKQILKSKPKKVHFDTTTRFLDACINFYKDEIDYLLESGVDVNCADKDNLTAIHQACINSRIDLVEFLLTKNANINVSDKEGWTPLHIAADIGSYELAKYLIDHGARLDIANYDGDLPISFVNESDYPDLKIYFQKEMDKRHIDPQECSNHERVVMLADVRKWCGNNEYNPPIDRVNRATPVHVAASKNYVEILLELLPLLRQDELNEQDIDGWTALHAAAHWGHKEACTILINYGADLDIRTRANETIWDIIDPDLKIALGEEIKKLEKKMRTHEKRNDISVRPDNNNRRRSSIVRQSVEWKKNFQMKDPASERETLVKAGINSDSSGINTIDEGEEKTISPVTKTHKHKDDISEDFLLSPMLTLDFGDLKTNNNSDCTDCDKTDRDSTRTNYSQNDCKSKISTDQPPTQIIQLANGNNFRNNLSLFVQEIPISDSNNGALMNEVVSDTSDSERSKFLDTDVQLRPRSSRDAIIAHRNTMDRTSLVMAPSKSDEAEVMRREKARRVRSIRRSTQAIDLGGYKEVESQKTINITDSKADSIENNSTIININAEIKNSKDSEILKIPNETVSEKKKPIDLSKPESKTFDIVKKEDTKSDFSLISKTNETNKKCGLTSKSSFDIGDSTSSVAKRNPLKYQVSCPTSNQSQSFTYDRARLNISNTIKGLIKKKPTETQKLTTTNASTTSATMIELPPGRGLNVNKFIEAGDSDTHNESLKDASTKYATNKYPDNKNVQISDNSKERDSGSFVAKPVLGNNNETKKSESYDTKHSLSISIDKADNDEISSTSECSDAICLKDENQISKAILSRMLNDQTTKQELVNEIVLLTEQLKEIKEKNRLTDSNLSAIIDKKTDPNNDEDRIPKLEMDMSKLRDENKKLKSQNEALLRVISRIQQELESIRKVPLH